MERRLTQGHTAKRLWEKMHELDDDYDGDATEYDVLRYPDEDQRLRTWITSHEQKQISDRAVDNGDFVLPVVNNICTAPN